MIDILWTSLATDLLNRLRRPLISERRGKTTTREEAPLRSVQLAIAEWATRFSRETLAKSLASRRSTI